jgi:hypothetical protein
LFDAAGEIAVLFVEFADEDEAGFLHFVEKFPDPTGADFHTAHAVDKDDCGVRGPDGGHGFTVEVGEAGCVDETDVIVLPLAVKRLGVDGDFSVQLVRQAIDVARAIGDSPMAVDGLGDEERGVNHRGFATGRMADDGDGADFRSVNRHRKISKKIPAKGLLPVFLAVRDSCAVSQKVRVNQEQITSRRATLVSRAKTFEKWGPGGVQKSFEKVLASNRENG